MEKFEEKYPEAPEPPSKPLSSLETLQRLSTMRDIYLPMSPSIETPDRSPYIDTVSIKPTNSFDINLLNNELVQHTDVSSEEYILTFPSVPDGHSFSIAYTIICPELPHPTKGELHMRIEI